MTDVCNQRPLAAIRAADLIGRGHANQRAKGQTSSARSARRKTGTVPLAARHCDRFAPIVGECILAAFAPHRPEQ